MTNFLSSVRYDAWVLPALLIIPLIGATIGAAPAVVVAFAIAGEAEDVGGDTAEMWRSLQRLARLPEEPRVFR